jgi:hypothetical protein
MKRVTFGVVLVSLLLGTWYQPVPLAQSGQPTLVGTWLLTSEQLTPDGGQPATAQGARGMLVFDAKGHYFELVDRSVPQALAGTLSQAQADFYRVSGSWGRYQVDRATGRIAFEAWAGRSANQTDARFSRTFAVAPVPDDEDRLTLTSLPGELHALAVTRRVWQRVPPMLGLPAEWRPAIGFWHHEVEGQKNADTGEILSEVRRDPSVIVYTTAGFVGVHFPTRNRTRFGAGEPTEAEARGAGSYLGYFGTLGVYPGGRHQGLVFHNLLGGGFTTGSTLRRFFDVRGEEIHLSFPPSTGRQGIRSQTYVRMRRLSGADDMLPR